MGLPLSLPGVQDSCAVLSVISSTDTLSGGPGGPKSMEQGGGWTWGDHPLQEASHWSHLKAITLSLINGRVLVVRIQGLHCVLRDVCSYGVITEHGSEKITCMGSLWGKEKGVMWGRGRGAPASRIKDRDNTQWEREVIVYDCFIRPGFTMLFALLLHYSDAFHDILPMCKWANYSHFLW